MAPGHGLARQIAVYSIAQRTPFVQLEFSCQDVSKEIESTYSDFVYSSDSQLAKTICELQNPDHCGSVALGVSEGSERVILQQMSDADCFHACQRLPYVCTLHAQARWQGGLEVTSCLQRLLINCTNICTVVLLEHFAIRFGAVKLVMPTMLRVCPQCGPIGKRRNSVLWCLMSAVVT